MERNLKCLRCNAEMKYFSRETFQLGQTSFLLGNLQNLMAGALEADIYVCPDCGKIEFFTAEDDKKEDEIAKIKCPKCGHVHDMDYPKCPFCKHSYIEL